MMIGNAASLTRGADGGQEAAVFLEEPQAESARLWLLPAALLLLLLTPLTRWGIPATQAGALPLYPDLAVQIIPPPLTWLIPGGEFAYKAMMGVSVTAAAGGVAVLARTLWGRGTAWWATSLWLTLPLTVGLIYQRGWPHLLVGTALLAVGLALSIGGHTLWRWLGIGIVLLGGMLLWQVQRGVYPYQLFAASWPDPANLREWLSEPTYQLGLVPFLLSGVAAAIAWPRRAKADAQWVIVLLLIALGCIILSLLSGPVLLYLNVAGLALVLATAALPSLDARYASFFVQLAILAIATLSLYPALRTGWIDTVPERAEIGTFIGEPTFVLVDVKQERAGDTTTVSAIWQVVDQPERDYTAFVHLLDAQGEIVGQADASLTDEEGVTASGWPVGYLVRQQYQSSSDVAPSQFRLGLYHLETLERLPVKGGSDSVTVQVE